MARGHGRILTSIWEDDEFLDLEEREQRLYLFLISQPNLNHAGLLDLTLRRWARKSRGLTSSKLEELLHSLEAARFIVMDDDTEELLIRSFVRNDGVWRMPKVMGAMVSGALEISSKKLRRALLAEMDRVPLHELNDEPAKLRNGTEGPSVRQQIESHIAVLRRAFADPTTDPTGGGSGTPSETPSDTPDEGGPKGSTRGRAGAHVHAAPAPAPTPTPAPEKRLVAPAEGHAVDDIVDVDFVESADADQDEPTTAQTIVAEYLDRVAKRPPSQIIGQVAKHAKTMLAEGIHPDDIRRGIALWMTKGLHPNTLPSVVNEAMNAHPAGSNVFALSTGGRMSTADQRYSAAAALAAELAAEDNQ
ncbi:hypothetical protein AVW11_03840 [Streptomyces amritsarensis]|uniref:Uncharacterized protein n=1 Tax=Streptomyces amritsarensis TaxID=681158 RepID=A0ABX3GAH9_9ACTN|nr:hypothetical protein [Streptomyces amritsarensis]OLZ72534.1 hypothetical protein AVW11_03840 [Streptomyces amritsarensis]